MVNSYVDDHQVIETMESRLAEKCRVTNVSISKSVDVDGDRLIYELTDIITGYSIFVNIDRGHLSGLTEFRKTELIYDWVTKYIKLLVNKRYGGEENK